MKKIKHKNKIRFDEYYACEILKFYLPEYCRSLKIVDSPDLQSDKFNIEVTSIQDKYQAETNALLHNKLFSNSDNPKLDKMLEQKGATLKDSEIILTTHKTIDLSNVLKTIIDDKMKKSYINNCNAIFFINYCYTEKKSKTNIKDIFKHIIRIFDDYKKTFQFIFLLYDESNFCYYDYSSNNITYINISRKQQMIIRSKYFEECAK